MRGIAAIMVMLNHEELWYGSSHVFSRAYLFVDFFFILSGLVLTLAYEHDLQAIRKPERFLFDRIMRLWPMLAVGILISATSNFLWTDWSYTILLLAGLSLLLIPMPAPWGDIYALNGPQWSIIFELLANYTHARWLHRLSDQSLLLLVFTFAATLIWLADRFGGLSIGFHVDNWWGGFFRVAFGYGLGMWMGRQFSKTPDPIDFGRRIYLLFLPLPILTLAAPGLPGLALVDCLIVFAAMPPIVWIAAKAQLPDEAAPAMQMLGKISYPLYAIHVPMLAIGFRLSTHFTEQHAFVRILTVTATLILAWRLSCSPLAKGIRRPFSESAARAIA